MNKLRRLVWLTTLASSLLRCGSAAAQSESAGVTQYFNNCASCHENTDPAHQAPRTAVLKQMTPEHVLDVLTNGSMRSNAAAISDADKRLRSRYPGFQNGQPGNVLLAFAPAVRLDVFADERKKKADGQ